MTNQYFLKINTPRNENTICIKQSPGVILEVILEVNEQDDINESNELINNHYLCNSDTINRYMFVSTCTLLIGGIISGITQEPWVFHSAIICSATIMILSMIAPDIVNYYHEYKFSQTIAV